MHNTYQHDHSGRKAKHHGHERLYYKVNRNTPGEASRSQRLVASSVTRSRRRWRLLAAEDDEDALDADETEGDRFARADSFFSFSLSLSFSLPRFSSCLDRLLSCRLDLRSRDRDRDRERERERRLRLSRVRSRDVLLLRRELFAKSEGESCQCKRGRL